MSETASDPAFEDAWRSVSEIEGWLTRRQAEELFTAARHVHPGRRIVEIGSHRGKSTVLLAKAKRSDVELLAVDPFSDSRWGGGEESYSIFHRNLERSGVAQAVTLHRGTSTTARVAAEDQVAGLIYVDGAHDRRSVLADLAAWSPDLEPGSLLYLHDAFSSPGVTSAILERLLLRRSFDYLGSAQSLAMFRKVDPSTTAAVVSAGRLVLRLGYFARNVAIKVALKRGWSGVPSLLRHETGEYPY